MPSDHGFVDTRWSVVGRAGGADDAARRARRWPWLVERYWEPLRSAARRWGCDDHRPRTRSRTSAAGWSTAARPRRGAFPDVGRFRAWLLVVFRNFLRDRVDRERAANAGGGAVRVDAATVQPAAPEAADPGFDRDWARAVLARATASRPSTPRRRSASASPGCGRS